MDINILQVVFALLLATCSALVRESDIIWFPVDDIDGVYVSSYGEKYRTNWNSRKARFSPDNPSRISKPMKEFEEYSEERTYDSPRMAKQGKQFEELKEENQYDSPRMSNPQKSFEETSVENFYDSPKISKQITIASVDSPRMSNPQKNLEEISEENFYDSPRISKQIKKFEDYPEENSYFTDSRFNDIPTRKPSKFSKRRRKVRQPAISDFQNEESDNIVPIRSRYRFYQKKQLNERPTKFVEIPKYQIKRRPDRNENQDAAIQEAIFEIFNINRPITEENVDSEWDENRPIRPVTEQNINSQWNQNRPNSPLTEENFDSQWNQDRPVVETSTQWNISPWPTESKSPAQFPKFPLPPRPVQESIYDRKPSRDSDKVIFPNDNDEDDSGLRVTTTESPTQPQITTPDCERSCQVTPEFNPVCGSDSINYSNMGRLKCAQICGKNVEYVHHGHCGRTRAIRPPAQRNIALVRG